MKSNPSSPSEVELSHDPNLVHQALDEIVRSGPFRTTRQCQNLLRYVVENSLASNDHSLRERVIGAEVFGRKPDYDTAEDPVVRIRASEVRKRLAQFYQGQHEATAVRIHIPSGSYRAQFEWLPSPEELPAVSELAGHTLESVEPSGTVDKPLAEGSLPVTTLPRHTGLRWAGVAALLLLLIAGAGAYFTYTRADRELERFWAPLLRGQKPALICMGSNAVYRFSNEFQMKYLADHHLDNHGLDFYPNLPADTPLRVQDLIPAHNSFVALGDVAAASNIVAMLSGRGRPYKERFPPDISFGEVSDSPAVLIGGFNNDLTVKLTRDFRFVLSRGDRVIDRQNPAKPWIIQFYGDGHDTEDYAIISRVLNPQGGGLVSVAGIGQFGTQAASEFVTSGQSMAALARTAPAQWSGKNMQIVLHIKVIDFRPVFTEVVAIHTW